MKPIPDCRETTRLILAGEDRPLSLTDRLRVRLHLAMCSVCPRFVRQVSLMRSAVGRWKGGEGPPAP
jgi:hypothetical protein